MIFVGEVQKTFELRQRNSWRNGQEITREHPLEEQWAFLIVQGFSIPLTAG
jgi:hypothetical protein